MDTIYYNYYCNNLIWYATIINLPLVLCCCRGVPVAADGEKSSSNGEPLCAGPVYRNFLPPPPPDKKTVKTSSTTSFRNICSYFTYVSLRQSLLLYQGN